MQKTLIATCIKDEQDYLEDFIKYHLILGVNEIHIFEDYGSTSHKSICDKYSNVFLKSILDIFPPEERDDIIQMRIDKVPCQTLYINQMLKYLHPTHNEDWWTFLTDIDEYITCTEKFPDILDKYKEHQAVLLFWQNYGCSGHIYKPNINKPIWEIYTEKCGYELYSDYKYFKITKFIVNMAKWKPTLKFYIHCANVDFVKADMSYKRTAICLEPLYLRHFILKSWEEWCYKILIRGCHHPNHRQYRSFFEMEPDMEEKIRNEKGFKEYFYNKYGVMPDY